jgi:hypothetical protein
MLPAENQRDRVLTSEEVSRYFKATIEIGDRKELPERPFSSEGEKLWIEKHEMVGARGFEPPASWTRTRRSTRLSHAPIFQV